MLSYIDPDRALEIILESTQPLPPSSIPVENACDLVLAEPLVSDRDYPPFNKAMMDGFAVSCEDAGKTVSIAATVAAGDAGSGAPVSPGKSVEIMTGAPCPVGTEAVVPVEDCTIKGDFVQLPNEISMGANIAEKGSDSTEGQIISRPGEIISPLVMANLAFTGYDFVTVHPRPSVGLIITGNEIMPDLADETHAIRDANGPMLSALCQGLGITEVVPDYAIDDPEAILGKLHELEENDIIILTGGVSMGKKDYVPAALESFGAELVFHKVAQRPGKPLLFARKESTLIFALPGNPLSCHLCFTVISPKLSGK
jgi:molybdopterin molybdotransferase